MNLLFLFFLEGDPAQKAVLTRTLKIKGAYITVSPRSQPGINTVTRQKQKATQNFPRVVRSPLPEKQSSVPQDKLPPKSAAFWGQFCVFAGKNAVYLANQSCKDGKSVGRDDWLWHIKSPVLPKAPSQSPRIQLTLNSVIRMPISNKYGTA